MIVDGERKFLKAGYMNALNAKKERMSKHAKTFGVKQRTSGGMSAVRELRSFIVVSLFLFVMTKLEFRRKNFLLRSDFGDGNN